MTFPFAACLVAGALAAPPDAAGSPVALDTAWPDLAGAKRIAGELTHVDHVNRTGILRPDRLGTAGKDDWDLPHDFDLPPYAAVRRCGVPSELHAHPLGTHLHATFLVAPAEVEDRRQHSRPLRHRSSPDAEYSRAVRLEDDFSFYTRLGLAWTIAEILIDEDVLVVDLTDAEGNPAEAPEGETTALAGRQRFHLGEETRVWTGDRLLDREALKVGQTVQLNLGWATLLGSEAALCRDVWVDDESRLRAGERQTRSYRASLGRRGVPAKVVSTENATGGGAGGTMVVELYDGVPDELQARFVKNADLRMCAVEPSLRTYEPLNDNKSAKIVAVTVDPDPPFGSSGLRLELTCYEMLEGFRADRTVRMQVPGVATLWSAQPREERLWPRDVRVLRAGVIDPTLRRSDPAADPK